MRGGSGLQPCGGRGLWLAAVLEGHGVLLQGARWGAGTGVQAACTGCSTWPQSGMHPPDQTLCALCHTPGPSPTPRGHSWRVLPPPWLLPTPRPAATHHAPCILCATPRGCSLSHTVTAGRHSLCRGCALRHSSRTAVHHTTPCTLRHTPGPFPGDLLIPAGICLHNSSQRYTYQPA